MGQWTGDTQITVVDGGGSTVVVPSSNVQVVMGCAAAGNDFEVVSTRSPSTIASIFQAGIMPEAAALSANGPGVVLCMKMPSTTAGLVRGSDVAALTVSAATDANPIVVTTSASHGLITGAFVTIAGVGGNTSANGTYPVTVLSPTTFSIPKAGIASYTSGGTVQPTGLWASMAGTSAVTVDDASAPYDDYYVQIKITKGGTVAAAGIVFSVSLDAGRNVGPGIPLGTATSYAIPNTGITIDFGTGTLIAGDTIQFSTIAPTWTSGDLTDALEAWRTSPYAAIGWGGGMHLVGVGAGSIAGLFQSGSPGLEQLAAEFLYTRGMMSARDASPPAKWGGTGEAEDAWLAAINLDFSEADAKRVLCGAGWYNTKSAFPNAAAGLPFYRRPLTWAQAQREITLAPQRHSGRVRDGALSALVLDPTRDPKDGFVYHDEFKNPSLDNFLPGGVGRFCAARTRQGKPGWYITNPRLLAPVGSDYTFWPRGAVMDVACTIAHQTGEEFVNDDVRTNKQSKGGTIYENDARAIESVIGGALRDQMVKTSMISDQTVSVDRTNNVQEDDEVNIAIEIEGKGYVLQENISIGFSTSSGS